MQRRTEALLYHGHGHAANNGRTGGPQRPGELPHIVVYAGTPVRMKDEPDRPPRLGSRDVGIAGGPAFRYISG